MTNHSADVPTPAETPHQSRVTPESQRHNPLTHPVKYLTEPIEDPLRPHTYDGIQEYDKRLPNWWLFTLYGAIAFSVVYWAYYHTYGLGISPGEEVQKELADNRKRAELNSGVLTDNLIYDLSQDHTVIAKGKATFDTTCASCHKPDLTGLIGPNLTDHEWIHGGKPLEAVKTISEGVLTKGMPSWASVLGRQKITEVAAYIFSKHQPGEPIVPVAGWIVPGMAVPTPVK